VGKEVHILTPTRYETPAEGNKKAVGINRDLALELHTGDAECERLSEDSDGDWKKGRRGVEKARIDDQGIDEGVMA
jgi:hypothetical protein